MGEVPTTVKHTQTQEAAPIASLPYSPENQDKIMEEWIRKAKSEAFQASL
jgi:muramidase (phage lysozyme)